MLSFHKIESSQLDYIKTSDALCNSISTDCLLKVREDDTCVYFHYRKDDGIIFYVGIGSYDRPYIKKCRFVLWDRTVKKHGYTIKVVHSGLSWQDACKLEIFYIEKFGTINKGTGTLVNLTDGGDGIKGYFFTEEQRFKISEASKKNWENSEFVKKWSIAHDKAVKTPEFRDKISKISTQKWQNTDFAEKQSIATAESWKDKDIRSKREVAIAAVIQSPQYKEKMSIISIESWQNPEIREKRIEGNKAITQTSEFSEKMSLIIKKRFENPENRKKQANITTEMWAKRTPEEKEKIIIKIRETKEKNKKERHEKGVFTKSELKSIKNKQK